jgi:TolA-binding protein
VFDEVQRREPGLQFVSEALLHLAGTRLLDRGRAREALDVFQMNVQLYPDSAAARAAVARARRAVQ